MSRFNEVEPAGESEWVSYDERIETLVMLRSDSENQRLSVEERDDAYEQAGKFNPTLDEWMHCRRIAERRWQISRERKIAKGHRPPQPMSVISREQPPAPNPDLGVVSAARGKRMLRAIFEIFREGGEFPKISPKPCAYFVRTDRRYADQYWYQVSLERMRRAWMTKRGLDYWPLHAIHLADLDEERPR